MYSNGVVSRFCESCIFYYYPGGLECFCRAFYPGIPLRLVTSREYDSNPSVASASDLPCDRYISFNDYLSDLPSRLDGGVK